MLTAMQYNPHGVCIPSGSVANHILTLRGAGLWRLSGRGLLRRAGTRCRSSRIAVLQDLSVPDEHHGSPSFATSPGGSPGIHKKLA